MKRKLRIENKIEKNDVGVSDDGDIDIDIDIDVLIMGVKL
jgi:hypothetical protein